MATYEIVRFFQDRADRPIVATGLTLEEAQEHCSDPEGSSQTAVSEENRQRTERFGAWFDGYRAEGD